METGADQEGGGVDWVASQPLLENQIIKDLDRYLIVIFLCGIASIFGEAVFNKVPVLKLQHFWDMPYWFSILQLHGISHFRWNMLYPSLGCVCVWEGCCVTRTNLNPFTASSATYYYLFLLIYRSVSTLSKNLTQFYTLFTKATFKSVSAKTAASDGTLSSTTSSARIQARSMQLCQEVWA